MRRIICLVLALCLFPFAGFAEGEAQPSDVHSVWQQFRSAVQETDAAEAAAAPTPVPSGDTSKNEPQPSDVHSVWQQFRSAAQETDAEEAASTPTPAVDIPLIKPQPMDALTFLHRYLYAMEAIGAAEAAYTFTPVLYTDIAEDEIYVMFNSLRLTLDRQTHGILYIDCAYSYEGDENVDILYQMVPAVIFALSENDLNQEFRRNLLKKGALVPYKDPAVSRELIDAINEIGGGVNGYYGSANGQGEIQFRLNWFDSPPREPFFPPADAQPMTQGVHLYQFYTAYYFALSVLSADLIEDFPKIDPMFAGLSSLDPTYYASQKYIPYDVGYHTSLNVDKVTCRIDRAESTFHVPREELSYLNYKEALSLCFALSGRPIWGELSVAPSENFLRVPESIAAFDSYLSTLYDHKTIGSYEFSLSEDFSHMVLFCSAFIE